MTKEEILAMKAGRELNIIVAEDVMGGKFMVDEIFGDTVSRCHDFLYKTKGYCIEKPFFGPLRHYSEDMAAAQEVIDKLKLHNMRVQLNHYTEKWEAEFSKLGAGFSYPVAWADTVPEAICKAALLAMLEAKK